MPLPLAKPLLPRPAAAARHRGACRSARVPGRALGGLVLLALCLGADGAQAQAAAAAGSSPSIRWATVDAGQAVLAAGGLQLSATVGQPDVPAYAALAGGSFRLRAGYWLTPAQSDDRIFANGFDLPN